MATLHWRWPYDSSNTSKDFKMYIEKMIFSKIPALSRYIGLRQENIALERRAHCNFMKPINNVPPHYCHNKTSNQRSDSWAGTMLWSVSPCYTLSTFGQFTSFTNWETPGPAAATRVCQWRLNFEYNFVQQHSSPETSCNIWMESRVDLTVRQFYFNI